MPNPVLVDSDGFAVADDLPRGIHLRFVGNVQPEDERGGDNAPCPEVRPVFRKARKVAHLW